MKIYSPYVQGLPEDDQVEILAAHLLESLRPEIDREFTKELVTVAVGKMVEEELCRAMHTSFTPDRDIKLSSHPPVEIEGISWAQHSMMSFVSLLVAV